MLRDLELDAAEEDEYSLLDGASFASAQPPQPPPVLTRARARAQGTSSPVLMTPVRTGGVSRGGGIVGVSPSSGATSRARMNSPIVVPAAKGTGKPQHCIFIDDAAMANLCFGIIGTGERFCLAEKIQGYTHCGISAHARGTRKKNKAKVVVDAFYVPGGTILARPTAKTDPMILKRDAPRKYLRQLETSKLTTAEWKNLIIDARTHVENSGEEDDEDEDDGNDDGDDDVDMADDGSLPSGFDEGSYDDGDLQTGDIFEVEWDYSQMGEGGDWVPSMKSHRAAIDLLGSILNSSTRRHLACVKALNARADLGNREGKATRRQVRRLLQMVHEHKTLADSVHEVLEADQLSSTQTMEELRKEMDQFAVDLQEFSTEARVTSESILKMFALIRQRAQARDGNMRTRIDQMEAVIGGFPRPPSPSLTTPRQVITTPDVGDTPLGTATIGGTETTLTANMLFNLVRELQGKVDLLTERAKHTGIVFDGVAFNSESELSAWFARHNPSGAGCAAMVDFQSIWAYAESDTLEASAWLSDLEKSRKMGFKGGRYEATYTHSMGMKYPAQFIGKEKTITSTTTIKMLESNDLWRGNGMGDGYKATLTKALEGAVERHRTYCNDQVPEGVVREMALKTAERTLRFWHSFVAYLDEEYSMLTSFNLLPKHILLLLSNQVIQICDDISEFRCKAVTTDISNPLATASRFCWVTLQAHGCMEAYLKDRFRRHPGINSSFIRFLTRHMADQTAMGLSGTVTALTTRVKKLEDHSGSKITQEMFNKLDAKVEAIITANDLKRKK